MEDFIDSREGLRAKKHLILTSKQVKSGDITGLVPVVLSLRPITVAYVKKATPEVVKELKLKYSYINNNPYENIKETIKGKPLERIQSRDSKKARAVPNENDHAK